MQKSNNSLHTVGTDNDREAEALFKPCLKKKKTIIKTFDFSMEL